jgi:hypothetical protein
MTLSTDVIVLDPVNPKAVFDHCLGMLGTFVDFEPRWEHTALGEARGFTDTAHYVSACGQGLPAWLWVHYHPDGFLDVERDEEDVMEDGGHYQRFPDPHCVRIDFDTAYGYCGPGGLNCGGLHAGLVRALGRWLDDRGVRWKWRNEYTGEWFTGTQGLDTLAEGTEDALAWFDNTVRPYFESIGARLP